MDNKKTKNNLCCLQCKQNKHFMNHIFNKKKSFKNKICETNNFLKIKVKKYLKNSESLECPTCFKTYSRKGNLVRHLMKKCQLRNIDIKKNDPIECIINDDDEKQNILSQEVVNVCYFCDKILTVKEYLNQGTNILIKEINNTKIINNNNNNNNNIIINNNNLINIVPYGVEYYKLCNKTFLKSMGKERLDYS
jgi:hypothetical protein